MCMTASRLRVSDSSWIDRRDQAIGVRAAIPAALRLAFAAPPVGLRDDIHPGDLAGSVAVTQLGYIDIVATRFAACDTRSMRAFRAMTTEALCP